MTEEIDFKSEEEVFRKVVNDPTIPRFYANQSYNVNTGRDLSILLLNNNVPVAVLNLSFNMAKTLALQIGELIRDFEDTTNTQILTILEIDESFKKKEKTKKSEKDE